MEKNYKIVVLDVINITKDYCDLIVRDEGIVHKIKQEKRRR